MVHARASLLGADRAASQGSSLDKYAYIRDFYLQQRRYRNLRWQPPRERLTMPGPRLRNNAIHAVEADGVAAGAMRLELAGLTGSGR
ncbi:MAG: hypothetical protein R3E34_02785 [Rhodocyclaceae bacterium]